MKKSRFSDSQIMAVLKPFGIEIETGWGQGWRMSAESKATVQAMLDQEAAQSTTN